MSEELVEIDGAYLEGGGQILRLALSLSALRKVPIRVTNIRAGRPKPGLMEQHLKGLEFVREICSGKMKGAYLGSKDIEFWPGEIKGGVYRVIVKTAGSICLLMQVALPCALFAKTQSVFSLQGGTNCEMAPQFDYMTEIFKPIMEKFGATFDFNLTRRGYFPRGGGEVVITVDPIKRLKPIEMTDRGDITKVYGWSFVAGNTLSIRLAYLMAEHASEVLKKHDLTNIIIEKYKEDPLIAPDSCSGIILAADTDTKCILGGSAIYRKGEKVEEVGKRAAEELVTAVEEGGCVDQHAQDQIIIYMALADGPSQVKVGTITTHTQAAIYVVELLTNVKFQIIPTGSTNIIQCSGSEYPEEEEPDSEIQPVSETETESKTEINQQMETEADSEPKDETKSETTKVNSRPVSTDNGTGNESKKLKTEPSAKSVKTPAAKQVPAKNKQT